MLIAHILTSYRNLNNESHDASMRYNIFDTTSAKRTKAKSIKDSTLISSTNASAKSAKGRFLESSEDMSMMSLDTIPSTFAVAKSGKAIEVVDIDSKSSKANPLPVPRSIDPLTISNDEKEISAALSFVEYSSPQEEKTSDAFSLTTTAVTTFMIAVTAALN